MKWTPEHFEAVEAAAIAIGLDGHETRVTVFGDIQRLSSFGGQIITLSHDETCGTLASYEGAEVEISIGPFGDWRVAVRALVHAVLAARAQIDGAGASA